ncbi:MULTISPECIES: suppressor of fused domain protein [unclassified Bacillus (in: firmicutes)]|uniref:suppressor of fused domain protein n=1 Tax=unclassified Bacillus (in: firmicutes) TaxID=185979 RepID=UPI0008E218A7|nr:MULTISPECIES: suppressor of fused domain protein [unclassified Bacillus (in: firmicutes)]SFI90129.1 Suppressor of fused protein (SUFU) [Bacillus sp. 71mf]SFS66507.1 Suppressor of fused protein (SUFU) [Bacillus sp. 103mf]
MILEEYEKRASEQEDWAPGWEAIDEIFDKLYPNQKPAHYGTTFHERSIFGGDQYLDGYSIYQSPNGYKHLLTYGMTELYTDEEAFGGEWSRFGYEMTIKLKEDSNEDCMWAIDMLSNLARYTYTQKRFFEPMQFVAGNGTSLHIGVESAITALLVVSDTEAEGIDTVHGRVNFIQLVGITQQELEVLKEDYTQAEVLVKNMKKDNPYLITDMKRIKSYL